MFKIEHRPCVPEPRGQPNLQASLDPPLLHADATDGFSTTRSEIWLPYGDIILQVGSTQFRVNRDVLARHSSVFDDMFSMPHPPEEPMQGCHIVDLADAAEDWSLLLEVLYNPFRQQTKCSFRMLAAMLRLGRKYDFREAYEDALSRIRFEFPSDFEAFDNLDANMTRIEYQRGIYCDLLNLAYECGVHSSIPLLAFCCLREETLETILTGVEREDNSCAVLSDDLKMPMALAFGRMALFQHQNLSWLRDDGVVPHSSCQSPTRCAQRRNTMAGVVDHDHQGQFNLGYTIDQWDDRWTGILCAPCEEAAATTYEVKRAEGWKLLPSFFGLPEWESLNDLA